MTLRTCCYNHLEGKSRKTFFIFFLIFSGILFFSTRISAAEINDTLHLNIQTTFANGSIQTGTFSFGFNITESSSASCLGPIVYNHTESKTTDSRGITSIYLPTSGSGGGNLSNLSFDKQYYVCYYRDGVLKDVTQLGRVPYSFRATEVNLSEIGIDSNLNLGSYNVSNASYGFFNFLGSIANRISGLFATNVNISNTLNTSTLLVGSGSSGSPSIAFLEDRTSGIFQAANPTQIGVSVGGTERLRVDNAGRLGVNTTSPLNTLHVSGELNVTNRTFFGDGSSSSPSLAFGSDSTTGWFKAANPSQVGLSVGGTERVRVDNSGRFGINTTGPTSTLHVAGTANITGATYVLNSKCLSGEVLTADATTGLLTCVTDSTVGSGSITGLGTQFYIPMWNGTTTLNNSNIYNLGGKIGIGTTTPTNTLNVDGEINGTTTIFAQRTKNLSIGYDYATNGTFTTVTNTQNYFANGTNINSTTLQSYLSNGTSTNITTIQNYFGNGTNVNVTYANATYVPYIGANQNVDLGNNNFTVNGSAFFVNTNNSRVGIGTMSPGDQLHLANFGGSALKIQDSDSTNGGAIRFSEVNQKLFFHTYNATGTFTGTRLTIDGANGTIGINQTSPQNTLNVVGNLNISNGTSGAVSLFTANTGRVGIGTASPDSSAKLHVAGGGLLVTSGAGVNTGGVIYLSNTPSYISQTNGGPFEISTDGTGINLIATDTNSFISLKTVNTERLRIVASGSIGINTSSPGATLNINSSNATGSFLVGNTTAAHLYVNGSSGRVGIGTSSPAFDLSLYRNGSNAVAMVQTGSAGSDPILQFKDGDDASNNVYAFQNSGSVFKLRYGSNVAAGGHATTDLVSFTSGGNVGINSSVPQNTLNVVGNLNVSNGTANSVALFTDNFDRVGIGTSNTVSTRKVTIKEASGVDAAIDFADTDNAVLGTIGIASSTSRIVSGDANLDLVIRNNQAANILFATNNAERARIDSSGRFGINTTSPNTLLAIGPGSISDTNVPLQLNAQGGLAYLGVNKNSSTYGALFGWDSQYGGVVVRSVNASDSITLVVNSTVQAVKLTNAGLLGVNTTTPQNTLNVVGNLNVSNGSANATTLFTTTAGLVGIGSSNPSFRLDVNESQGGALARFKDADSAYPGIVIGGDTNGGYISNTNSPGLTSSEALYLQNSINAIRVFTTGSERLRIDSSGNVGINTTTPQNKLNVVGDANVTGTFYGTNAEFNGGWANGGVSITGGNLFAQAGYFYNISSLNISTLNVNGSTMPMFDDTFDLGNSSYRWRNIVGTTVFSGGYNLTQGYLSTVNGTYVPYVGATKNLTLGNNNFSVNGTTLFVDTNTSRVGIGTSSPSNKLVVSDSSLSGFEFTPGSASQRSTLSAYNRTSSAYETFNLDALNFLFRPSGSAQGDFYINGAGSVGINTTAPQAALNVNSSNGSSVSIGNLTGSHLFVNGTDGKIGIGTQNPSVNLHVLSSDNAIVLIESTTTSKIPKVQIKDFDNGDYSWEVGRGSLDGIRLYDNTAGATRLFVDSSGRTGINTTTPQNTLDVKGNANVTGTLRVGATNSTTLSKSSTKTFDITMTNEGSTGHLFRVGLGGWSADAFQIGNSDFSSIYHNLSANENSYLGNPTTAPSFKLGINTTTPQNTLNVVGSANVTQVMYIGTSQVSTDSGGTMIFKLLS